MSSIVFALVSPVSISRYNIVDAMTMIIRIEVKLTILHIMTGNSKRNVTKNSNSPLALRLIRVPGWT